MERAMPMKPPTFQPPGMPTPGQSRREYETMRKTHDPWRKWFSTKQWERVRAAQLAAQPLCERCTKKGFARPATALTMSLRTVATPNCFEMARARQRVPVLPFQRHSIRRGELTASVRAAR
jgi:hypothetical protein